MFIEVSENKVFLTFSYPDISINNMKESVEFTPEKFWVILEHFWKNWKSENLAQKFLLSKSSQSTLFDLSNFFKNVLEYT